VKDKNNATVLRLQRFKGAKGLPSQTAPLQAAESAAEPPKSPQMKAPQKNRLMTIPAAFAAVIAMNCPAFAASLTPDQVQQKAAQIDAMVNDNLAKQKIAANAPASDEIFVRRVYLDIVGRIPTLKETTDFLASKEGDKRAKLIDSLLASDGYTQNFFNYWADILRLKSQSVGGGQSLPAGYAYANWLQKALEANTPYDQMVKELVTADGKTYENGAVGFYIRDYNMPLDNMAVTTQIFLGTSMVCAQCHNHPFDKWTQMDYYQMAGHSYGMTGSNGLNNPLLAQAIYGAASGKKAAKAKKGQGGVKMDLPDGLAKTDVNKAMTEILRPLRYNTVLDQTDKRPLRLPHDYQYDDAKPSSVVEPTIPAAFSKDGKVIKEGERPIDAYGQWMTSKSNPRFTTVIANRLWKRAMGLGLIEPVDEITDSTVPSNPKLMAFLEDTMKELNYDMKAYLRILYNSAAYQRAAYTKDVELGEVYHFPGPILRRMTAEQIWDSMVALYKPSPDQISLRTAVERTVALRRIEWLDRALNALTADELKACAIKVAQTQKRLAGEVRKAQVDLTAATKAKDEAGIRAAKRVVSTQRKQIDATVQEIVFTAGFKKFAELARDGKLSEQVNDPEFAKEIAAVIKSKNGADLQIDEALNVLARQERARLATAQKARMKRDAETFAADDKKEKDALRAWEDYRDEYMIRSADLRSPAPNGHFLREFGQSDRELVENSNDEASVGQALMLLNGRVFSQLVNPYTVISRTMKRAGDKGPDAIIDSVYLTLMSRKATEEEKALLRPVVDKGTNTARGDLLWTVLNTRQFFFIQ